MLFYLFMSTSVNETKALYVCQFDGIAVWWVDWGTLWSVWILVTSLSHIQWLVLSARPVFLFKMCLVLSVTPMLLFGLRCCKDTDCLLCAWLHPFCLHFLPLWAGVHQIVLTFLLSSIIRVLKCTLLVISSTFLPPHYFSPKVSMNTQWNSHLSASL